MPYSYTLGKVGIQRLKIIPFVRLNNLFKKRNFSILLSTRCQMHIKKQNTKYSF
jgi:hypothetical protein